MKKLIDFDGLFDKKLEQYMQENVGKYTEKQWESLIPRLYVSFGDTFIKAVGNTPKGYYAEMTDAELCDSLSRHVSEDVPVSDFLCRELEKRNCPDELLALLKSDNVQLLTLVLNIVGSNPKAFPSYLDLIVKEGDTEVKDTAVEQLKGNPDPVKDQLLDFYQKGIEPELMLEMLSRVKERDDRIYDTLIKAFRSSDEIPMHASYLAAYGDPRALEVLLNAIDGDVNYVEFQELKYAIETLGGEYTKLRDFSEDPYYQEVIAQSQMMPDFTDPEKK